MNKLSKQELKWKDEIVCDYLNEIRIEEECNEYYDNKYNRSLNSNYFENLQLNEEKEFWKEHDEIYDDSDYEDGLDKMEI